MAIRTVANASQLNSAIKAAGSGDTIQLKAGYYGQIKIANSSKALTIESESAWNPATFKGIQVQKSSNLTFDNLDFKGTVSGGWGTGTGINVWDSRNIRIEDSDFQDYYKAVSVNRADGITVARNDITRSSEDGMAFSGINGLQVVGNKINGMKSPVQEHHDMIQVHVANGPSSNVVVRDNVLDSNDLVTYGISFFGSGTHRNVTIDNNKVIAGHHHGITVNSAAGLKITNNTVLKDASNNSFRDIDTPEINVGSGSSGVQITGNTAYDINASSGVGANKIVSESVKFSGSTTVSSSAPTSSSPSGNTSGTPSGSTSSEPATAGDGDTFRFSGTAVDGWTRADAKGVDFSDGDTIVLSDYDWGTFKQHSGGNWLQISSDGRTATLDSRADVKELMAASSDVGASKWNDTLALTIKQDDGVHFVVLQNIGDPGYFF